MQMKQIIGFDVTFNASEGDITSTASITVDLGSPVSSISDSEKIEKIDIQTQINNLISDLKTKGATITKLVIEY
jgi:hypothetical protein